MLHIYKQSSGPDASVRVAGNIKSFLLFRQFLRLLVFLWKAFVHFSFFYLGQHLEEIVGEFLSLLDAAVIHDSIFWDTPEGEDYLILYEGLSLQEAFVVVFFVNIQQAVFFEKVRIDYLVGVAENQRYEFLCVFFGTFEALPHFAGEPQVRLVIFWPLDIDVSPNSGHKMLLEVVERRTFN